MKLTQISVFLENKRGRLCEACTVLGEAGVNIRALTIADSEDFGVMRMVVDRPDEAVAVLRRSGFVATPTDIVAVEVEDRPGGLARILQILTRNNINVEYMYGFVEKSANRALMVFRVEDPAKAHAALTGEGIKVLTEADVKKL